jgi:hypothetical protein
MEEECRIYAVAVSFRRYIDGVLESRLMATAVLAVSLSEAEEKALEQVQKTMPASVGWEGYVVALALIDDQSIVNYLRWKGLV